MHTYACNIRLPIPNIRHYQGQNVQDEGMLKWGELVSNSRGIEVNNRTFWPRRPSSAVTLQCVMLTT